MSSAGLEYVDEEYANDALEPSPSLSASAWDADKLTPHNLFSHGYSEIARALLGYDADAEAQGFEGWTLLHYASRDGHVDVARFLLERGADASHANSQDHDKSTPLHQASGFGHIDIVRVLQPFFSSMARMPMSRVSLPGLRSTWLPKKDNLRLCDCYSIAAKNANAKHEDQQTPLSLALSKGRLEVAQLSLEDGAEVNSLDWPERSPLHGALENGQFDVMLLLLDQGADINAKDAVMHIPGPRYTWR